MQQNKRYYFIDIIESLAMLMVILCHCETYSYDIVNHRDFLTYIAYYSRAILSTAVPLFFLANGYLLFSRPMNIKKHMKKTLRLVFLSVIWSIIVVAGTMIIRQEPLSPKNFVLTILYQKDGWLSFIWYIGALVSMYIFFPALKFAYDNSKRYFMAFTFICFLLTFGIKFAEDIIAVISILIGREPFLLDFEFIQLFNPFSTGNQYTFVYFCLGGLIFHYQNKIITVFRNKRITLLFFVFLLSVGIQVAKSSLFSLYYNQLYGVIVNGYKALFNLIASLSLFIIIMRLNYDRTHNGKIITLISKNTLGIYFMHELVLRITLPYVKQFFFFTNIIGNIVYGIIVLLICLCICLLLRKIPVLRKIL